jgi:hypothetical protein
MKHLPYLCAFITTLLAMACAESPLVCTDEFRQGIVVTVVDSITGAPPDEAVLLATSSGFVDSVGPATPVQTVVGEPPTLVLTTAGERAGSYSLVVRSQGYSDWQRANVVVTADACHVRTVMLTARLQVP